MKAADTDCLGEGLIIRPTLAVACEPFAEDRLQGLAEFNATTLLLLEALEDTPHHEPAHEPGLQQLDAKLNLLLHLVTQLLEQQQRPPRAQPVSLSVQGIAWDGVEADCRDWRLGQPVLLSLYLSPRLARPLCLPGKIAGLEPRPSACRIGVRFTRLADVFQEHWEKWLFRQHRREIAQQRHGG